MLANRKVLDEMILRDYKEIKYFHAEFVNNWLRKLFSKTCNILWDRFTARECLFFFLLFIYLFIYY